MIVSFTLLIGLLLDHILGEAKRFHLLVLFGKMAKLVERLLNTGTKQQQFIMGIFAWCVLVLPVPIGYFYLATLLPSYVVLIFNLYFLYWAVALNSLEQHGMQIYQPLRENSLAEARHYCGYIVSRDTSTLDEQGICRATTESMLENGHDGVTATLIYFVVGGAPLVIMHRLSNTLDAMWGYRTAQFNYFGKFSARMDDLLGFASGKITALLFAAMGLLNGHAKQALLNGYQQSKHYKSHNGGWVMASGATVMQVALGGNASYFGKQVTSPVLGEGEPVQAKHIKRSLMLVKKAVLLWLALVFISELLLWVFL